MQTKTGNGEQGTENSEQTRNLLFQILTPGGLKRTLKNVSAIGRQVAKGIQNMSGVYLIVVNFIK